MIIITGDGEIVSGPGGASDVLLAEDGTALLAEDGTFILNEDGD